MAKKKKGKSKSKGWPRWLTFVLAGAAIAGVMGAFDRLVNYDKSNNMVSGLFAAGVAISAAFLLRKGKLINGAMAGVIGGVGIAYAADKIMGPKLYEIGGNIADSFGNMFNKNGVATRTTPSAKPQASFDQAQYGNFSYSPDGPSPSDMTNAIGNTGGNSALQQQINALQQQVSQTTAAPQQPQTITYITEAPKIKSGDYLLGKAIDAAGSIGGALVTGLTGSKGDATRRRFGRAA